MVETTTRTSNACTLDDQVALSFGQHQANGTRTCNQSEKQQGSDHCNASEANGMHSITSNITSEHGDIQCTDDNERGISDILYSEHTRVNKYIVVSEIIYNEIMFTENKLDSGISDLNERSIYLNDGDGDERVSGKVCKYKSYESLLIQTMNSST